MPNITPEQIAHVHELHMLLSVLWKASMQHIEAWLNEHQPDITRLQYGILRMLDHEGAQILSDLSKKFGLDPSTLVPTINAMEKKRYVERKRDPQDRRRVPISITDLGRDIVRAIPTIDTENALVGAMNNVGEEKTQALLELLYQLVEAMPDGAEHMAHIHARLKSFSTEENHYLCKRHAE